MPSVRAILLDDIRSTKETLARLERELKEETIQPLEFVDDDGDRYTVMSVDSDGDVDVDLCTLYMKDIPNVIEWLQKVIGEEQ